MPDKNKIFIVTAHEQDSGRERAVEFIVQAPTHTQAEVLARKVLSNWWGEPDAESADNEFWFFGGEICIHKVVVEQCTADDAIAHFTMTETYGGV
jgi:hypothetical protein